MKGFSDLETPLDLLEKVKHDLKRLNTAPLNSYSAFDLFVTASCIPDWYCHINGGSAEDLRKEDYHLEVCHHIAIGAKHFNKTRGSSSSVSNAEKKPGWGPPFDDPTWYSRDWGFQPDLKIMLDGDAKKEIGASITARVLAEKVIEFWEEKLSKD